MFRVARNSLGSSDAPTGPDRQAAAFIRQQRRRRGQSAEQLGHDIGVSGNTIRRCELGFLPYANTQKVIARFFSLEPDEIWRKDRLDYLRSERAKKASVVA